MRTHDDIISTLPDDLLCRIISLLPSKEAIRTSILSSRWKSLMDFVPVLDITCHVPTLGFINTVDKLLLSTSSSSNLQKLRLQINDCHWSIVPVHVNNWVRSAINRNVVDLDVCLPDFPGNTTEYREEFALHVVASDSLQVLNISGGLGLHMPYITGCFKNLKTFNLNINNPDKEILAKLFCSLPELKELAVEAKFSKSMKKDMNMCINIIASALKKLWLCICQVDYHDVDFKVLIDTPMLEYMYLGDDYLAAYSVMSTPFLVKATLNVGMGYYHADYTNDDNRFVRVIELMRGLSNAKSLSILNGTSVALDWVVGDLPLLLHGLTYLVLDDLPLTGRSLIPRFLESAPNLKSVAVIIRPRSKFIMPWFWGSPTTLPSCFLHLEAVKVLVAKNIKDGPSFPVMVNYIANNAKVLKNFIINGHRLV